MYTIFESIRDIDTINDLISTNTLSVEDITYFCHGLCQGRFFINRIKINDFLMNKVKPIFDKYNTHPKTDVQRNRIAITVNFLLYHTLNTESNYQNKKMSGYNGLISFNKFGCNFTYQFDEMFDVPAMYVLNMCIK